MARVPAELIRRGLETGPKITPHVVTQQRIFDMRRRLHLQLRDMTEEDMRRVSMATCDSMMMQLWREGHIWAGRMLTEFLELDRLARKICMMVAPYLRRGTIRNERKLLRFLAAELCAAEDAMRSGDAAKQAEHLLFLAQEIAVKGLSWWWLTERLLKEATAAAAGQGEVAATVSLAKGSFLLNQLHESGEAVDALDEARKLSQGAGWVATVRHMMWPHRDGPPDDPDDPANMVRVKTPPDIGPDQALTVFECACAVLSRALLQEARRARRGCGFGVAKRAPPPTVTQASEPRFPQTGNPFQEQVTGVELRTPRIISDDGVPEKPVRQGRVQNLDLARMLREDMEEPDVKDPGKVDTDSAAAFCREAIQHAREADRRDLEEAAQFELGMCLLAGEKYSEAINPFQTVLLMYTEDGNSIQVIKTHFQVALCYQRLKKIGEAHAELHKGLRHAQDTNNRWYIFVAHKYIGMFFLNSTQRQYATTHLALAVIQSKHVAVPFETQSLVRVLAGVSAAAELMPAHVALLQGSAPTEPHMPLNINKLIKWQDLRTPFWPAEYTVSRAVLDLETVAPWPEVTRDFSRLEEEDEEGEKSSEEKGSKEEQSNPEGDTNANENAEEDVLLSGLSGNLDGSENLDNSPDKT